MILTRVLAFLNQQNAMDRRAWRTGCSGLGHWDDPEGWDGKGGGRAEALAAVQLMGAQPRVATAMGWWSEAARPWICPG